MSAKISKCLCRNLFTEGVHLTLPTIISVRVKPQSMLHHGSVGASLKQDKRNLTLIPDPNP